MVVTCYHSGASNEFAWQKVKYYHVEHYVPLKFIWEELIVLKKSHAYAHSLSFANNVATTPFKLRR